MWRIVTFCNPVGPTAEQLFSDYGSWEKVIENSMQKDAALNTLLGLSGWHYGKAMIFQRFNQYGVFAEVDLENGVYRSVALGVPATGVFDELGEAGIAAIFVKNTTLFLLVGERQFNLERPGVKTSYIHNEDGTTTFSFSSAEGDCAVTYPSWWKNVNSVAALDDASDDDEDILAYLRSMLGANGIAHLKKKFGDQFSDCEI